MKSVVAAKSARGKDKRVWVIVADGGQARILESDTAHAGVSVRLDINSDARQTGGKLAAGRLPRTQESSGSARHGIEPRVSLKQHEKDLFVARLADYLKGSRSRFDQLVIVAPVKINSALKAALPVALAERVVMSRNSDMTWMSVPEVLKRLGPLGAQIQKARGGS
ncbi:host attachment protein [Dongia sp.]|uniref:host attachment protein n=1 Tax=Dongia sp. TaxID=1977262 RepID=UPI0035B12961